MTTVAYCYPDARDDIPRWSMRVRDIALSDAALVRQVVGWLPARPRRVVDVGGGDGRLLPVVTEIADAVVLVEPDGARLARARSTSRRSNADVTFVEHDVATFANVTRQRFDLVLCSHVIQHLSRRNRVEVLAALRRLLTDDGHALVTFPAIHSGRSRYLLSRRPPGSTNVSTTTTSARHFDMVAEAANQPGPDVGLPVWHPPVGHVVRGLERAALHVRATIAYRPFDFDLRDASGATRRRFATDTAVLAASRPRSAP